jgi:hypothetical protein
MPSTFSPLKIQLMATGENNTTWGDVTNLNLGTALEEAIVGSADVTFASADVTLTLTDTNASQTARNMRLRCTGTTGGSTRNLIVPSIEKPYIVSNDCADSVIVKNATGTGITVPAGKTMWVYNNATNVVDAVTHLSSLTLGTDLAVSDGGTGASTFTANGVIYGNTTSALLATAAGTTGQVLVGNTGAAPSWATLTGIGVTSFSAGTTGLTPNTATTGAITLAGTLGVANGGTGTNTAFTAGSVVFAGASGVYSQDNANLFWDNANDRLGIGTATPLVRLNVEGGDFLLRGGIIDIGPTAGANGAGRISTVRGGDGVSGNLIFGTLNSSAAMVERMRIDGSGSVGVGVTPSAWGSMLAVQVGTAASFNGGSGYNDAFIASNAYFDGTNWRYINSNPAYYNSIGGTAAARWYTAASGTAGNAISFTQAMTLDTSGNLIVGGTTGNGRITARGAGTTGSTYSFEAATSGGATRFIVADNGESSFYNSSSALSMRIDSSGNVGIGTTSPTFPLCVSANSGTDQAFMSGVVGGAYFGAVGAKPIIFQNDSTEKMRIDSAGNVGIGTTTPVSRFHVNTAASAATFATVGNNNGGVQLGVRPDGVSVLTSYSGTGILFGNNNVVSFNELMRIEANGNVGIGTSSTSGSYGKLTVAGGVRTVEDTSSKLELGRFSAGAPNSYIKLSPNSASLRFTNAADDADLMTLTNAGNLGIGTTSPAYKLVVGGASGSTTTPTALSMDGTYASAPAWDRLKFYLFKNSTESYGLGLGVNADMQYWAGPTNDGIHTFFTRQTERMRLDNNGNLGVGTTNPAFYSGRVVSNADGASIAMFAANNSDTGSASQIVFDIYRNGTRTGSITNTNAATAYNTSSDYRLKEIDGPIVNSGTYIDALNPVQGSWKVDGSRFIGLLAHEVQEVSETPIATGEKDGEEMQGMDYSAPELIANLIAEIQSLRARVAQLEGN